jgi:hypothetical protein
VGKKATPLLTVCHLIRHSWGQKSHRNQPLVVTVEFVTKAMNGINGLTKNP